MYLGDVHGHVSVHIVQLRMVNGDGMFYGGMRKFGCSW